MNERTLTAARESAGSLDVEDVYVLSPMQQGMLFHDLLEPGTGAYVQQTSTLLRGAVDADLLRRAWQETVDHHPALRTTFVADNPKRPLQVVRRRAAVAFVEENWRRVAEEEREARFEAWLDGDRRRGFDLAQAPLLRLTLQALGEDTHRLVWTFHHLVLDGWSASRVLADVFERYAAARAGRAPIIDPVRPYRDFIAWLRRRDASADETFWRARLGDFATPTPLVVDRLVGTALSPRDEPEIRLNAASTAAIDSFARSHGLTVSTLVHAAWAILLSRYGDDEDVLFGSTVSGRPTDLPGVESMIGLFINTIPVRVRVDSRASIVRWLAKIQEELLEIRQHEWTPLSDAQNSSRVPRGTPLFESIVVFENYPMRAALRALESAAGFQIDSARSHERTKYPLTLVATPDECLSLRIEHDPGRFDAATISRMLGHLQTILDGLVAAPDAPLSALSILTAEERAERASPRPLASIAPAGSPCVNERFDAQVTRTPDAVAVAMGEDSLTYRELDRRAESLARRLRGLGVSAETRVGVCIERSIDLVVGILATVKAGGAYVPIDPAYPKDRIAFLLEDSRAAVLLTSREIASRLPEHRAQVLAADDPDAFSTDGPEPARASVLPDHALYVIYTSGSTGKPKGVVVTHRNVARLFDATGEWFHFDEHDAWTLFHSASFDFSVWEMWGALLHGGRLVVVPFWVSRSPEAFLELVARERITVLNQTPSAFRQLMRADEAATPPLGLSLRLVIFGGEALDPRTLRPWFDRRGDRRPLLVNMYGITETTVHVTYRPLSADDSAEGSRSLIGRAIPDLRLDVVDSRLEPVPIGVPGELLVGGAGVARGYLDRPDLTAARFVPDPWSSDAGSRRYRSGDRARRLPNGDVEYLGRIDLQVKIRGFRIELGEIEAALLEHPSVGEAVVVTDDGAPDERRLAAYVVLRRDKTASVDELRRFLRAKLPEHAVPAFVVTLEALPLTAHGKVDRHALPSPDGRRAEQDVPFVAPRTPIEATIASVWSEALGRDAIGIDDNYFAVGGDSIRSIRVRALAREKGIDFTLQQLFENPSVRRLAQAMETRSERVVEDRVPPFGLVAPEDLDRLPPDLEDALPLSMLQAGMVFHSEATADYIVYVTSLHLRARLDLGALERAARRLVARHGMLRTSFDLTSFSEPLQLVHRDVNVSISANDLSGLPPNEQQAEIDAWIATEMRRKIDWSRAPLLRLHVHRRGDDTFQFTLTEPVFDGWSVATLLAELFADYLAILEDRSAPNEPMPSVTYRHFVALERESLRSNECRRYWARQLSERPPCRVPLGSTPAPRADAPAVAQMEISIPREVADGLQRLARATGAPIKTVLLAAHLKAIGALTGQSRVATGFLINGRPEEMGGERLLGAFLNTAPFALDLRRGSWLELVQQAFAAELELLPFRRFPIQELERLYGAESLMNTVFNFTHFHVYQRLESIPGIEVLHEGGGGTEQTYFALTAQFNLDHSTAVLSAWLDYRTLEVSRERAEAIAAAYARVLAAMAAAPSQHHESFALSNEDERRRLLVEWNDTAAEIPRDATLHSLVEAEVDRAPNAIALEFDGRALTYREMDRQANRLASRLRALGVGPGILVGIVAEQSIERVVGILAVLKAGAAYVPVDPSYPRDRIAFLLEDAKPRVVLCPSALAEAVPTGEAEIVLLDAGATSHESDERPKAVASPRDLAYVIYTSGSTGKPKGVMVEHQSVVNVIRESIESFGVGRESRLVQLASTSFDASVLEIFTALAAGARLHLVDRETLLSPDRLAALFRDARITSTTIVPSVLDTIPTVDLPDLATVVVGGEACSADTAARWSRGRRLLNVYAPTETTIYTTIHRHPEGLRASPAIGRPIRNARLYLLDPMGQPVPVGVAGEIHVAGIGVARGYLDRPDVTAVAFVPDPFSREPGARLYRTGDLARFRPDGTLEFVGRSDRQVKIRGHRIELGEIEAALAAHAAVHEAVVLAREDVAGAKRLAAYAVLGAGAAVESGELRRFLSTQVPEFAVPSAIVVLDAMPRDANGKVDRRALPCPEATRTDRDGSSDPPRNPVEEIVAGIWADLFRVAHVGIHESFFELGGHSLLATQLVSRVRDALRVELPIRSLFEEPTVAGLAQRIEAARQSSPAESPKLERSSREKTTPLSFAQQRLWFLDQLAPGTSLYHISVAVRLEGRLDRAALERSFDEIVRRHEAVRTTFSTVDGVPVQVIAPPSPFSLSHVDLAGLSAAKRDLELRRLAAEDAEEPFDLARGPLLRATLVRLGDAEHALFVTMHHIVSDAWSMGVFVRELGELYDAIVTGREAALAPLPVQYADFATWQRGWLRGDVLAREVAWWKNALRGAPPFLELPADRPRPPLPTHRGATMPFDLPKPLADALTSLARRERATLFMTLLAAFQVVVQRITGEDDVVVGSPIANRSRAETEGLIGFFVNTLVLRTDLSGDPTFRDLVARVRENCLGAYAHQDVPFEKLVEAVEPVRDLARAPLFQILFDLQNAPMQKAELRGLRLVPLDVETHTAKFDLSLALHETEDGLTGGAEYATDLFDEPTIARLLDAFRRVLEAAVADPARHISSLPLVDDRERRRLLDESRGPAADFPRDAALHSLFEAAADAAPDALALEAGGKTFTYGELEHRANRLAHRLIRLGVGPEDRVAVLTERSVETIAGILAILKAGGAYVPIDPTYPKDRIAFLLEDARPRVVLATQSRAASLPPGAATIVPLDGIDSDPAHESDARPKPRSMPEALAYVIYTSGSTGKPKGVMVSHRNAVHSTSARSTHYGAPPVRFALLSSFAFDSSIAGLFWTLASGGTLVLPPEGVEKDPRELVRFVETARVSHVLLLPTLHGLLLDAAAPAAKFESLVDVIVAGEACVRDVVERHHSRLRHVALHNEYGPTEATVWSSVHRCEPGSARPLVPIGRPIPRARIHVLDAHGGLCPVGAPGEIVIGGDGVARGYLARADLTALRFVPD
ncbi:MAG: amino acid adenylation domain-containing protein, partial [Planctomycetes bacterium]|nr:amino acid adenylation domain-containing protein [Planctomycetota bacterium]